MGPQGLSHPHSRTGTLSVKFVNTPPQSPTQTQTLPSDPRSHLSRVVEEAWALGQELDPGLLCKFVHPSGLFLKEAKDQAGGGGSEGTK